MNLADYLRQRRLTQQDFAGRADIPQGSVSTLVNGGDAKGKTWAKIMRATRGKVSPTTHFPEGR